MNTSQSTHKRFAIVLSLLSLLGAGLVVGRTPAGAADARDATPHVNAITPEAAGKYLIQSAGCNDCHTPGWMETGGKTPEALWLTGVPVGWRGPWGTTYASNLRRFVQPFTEEQFVHLVRTRNSRPPMPWMSLHAMSDRDLTAIYRYIRSLPLEGDVMPDYVPPELEPKTPFFSMVPQNLPAAVRTQASAKAQAPLDAR